jgi:ribosomal protein S18 acetylase RimI-like enzyme
MATTLDAPFISNVVVSAWQDAYQDFLPPGFLASLAQNPHHDVRSWRHRISEPGSTTWVVSDDGNEAGVMRMIIGTSSIPGTEAQLTTLYLLKQARGRGLGSEALAFARTEAARRALGFMGVCVLAGNKAGQDFYKRRGARRIGERVAFRLNDQPILDILYRFDRS